MREIHPRILQKPLKYRLGCIKETTGARLDDPDELDYLSLSYRIVDLP